MQNLHPCRPWKKTAQKQTKEMKENSPFVLFVPFCSKRIRVIRAIRGMILAKMGDSDGLQCVNPDNSHLQVRSADFQSAFSVIVTVKPTASRRSKLFAFRFPVSPYRRQPCAMGKMAGVAGLEPAAGRHARSCPNTTFHFKARRAYFGSSAVKSSCGRAMTCAATSLPRLPTAREPASTAAFTAATSPRTMTVT